MAQKKDRTGNAGSKSRVPLPGSERSPLRSAKVVGSVDPDLRVEITLQLRRRTGSQLEQRVSQMATQRLDERTYLTREELGRLGGAEQADISAIDAFAHDHNLSVSEVSIARRTVKLVGRVADLSTAFGVTLKRYRAGAVSYRGRRGPIYLPKELAGVVERVLGLDDRPAVTPHYRVLRSVKGRQKGGQRKDSAHGSLRSFSPLEVAKLYNFPAGLDGTGQTIGLIELNDVNNKGSATGAGYSKTDLDSYFAGLGLATPNVNAVGVDGGANVPGPDLNADSEVTLDIEVAGAVAPKANIVVYFGTNTTDGFIQALTSAIHDDVRKPSLISISWGGPEESSTQQLLTGLDQALQEAAAVGVTVCAAAGDNGSADMDKSEWDGVTHADFPASSPWALGCGGTTLQATGSGSSETVWNGGPQGGATGGGVSNVFARPAYQLKVNVPQQSKGGRGLPDVSGNADPASGYQVLIQGASKVLGGTSAVAPLWAGLLALISQQRAGKGKGPLGFLNPILYGLPSSANAFQDVVNGNNDIFGTLRGKYPAGPGWDPCTGLGTPNGTNLSAAL
ncbi:MAG TPA: S53 family peptidase [Vicinamibacteria bacterium]|jgi:kumamolisin|nr:S53 family peptidase [Vicinamibacteria bacterium]